MAGGVLAGKRLMANIPEKVYGHNEKKYQLNINWGKLDTSVHPVNDCMKWYKIAGEEFCC